MPNVILVDDEFWALRDLESLLSPYPNYRILGSFTDSREAWNAIVSMQPDIVFTDLCMAEMDGRELINEIHERFPKMAIVIVSAYRDFNVAREALNRHVIDYLLKPLSPENVAALIARLDAEFVKASQRVASPQEMFAAQLRKAAMYNSCCVLSFPDDIQPDATLRTMHDKFRGTCSYVWAEESDAAERILLFSMPASIADTVLAQLPEGAGVSRVYADFSDYALMKRESVVSRICALRYADNPKVSAIESYLAAHYAEDITLDHLAQHFFLSKNYLCDIFRSTTGTTVMTFLIEIRLAVAAYMMRDSECTIRDVAASVGYDDSSYFSRAFKKLYGVSPEVWRQKHNN